MENHLSYQFAIAFQGGESKVFKRRDLIHIPNKESGQVFFVAEGAIKIYKYFGNKTFLKYFIFEGEIFGLDGLIGEEQYANFAEVISQTCKLKVLSTAKLCQKIARDPVFTKAMLQVLRTREEGMYERFQDKMFKSTEQIIIGMIREFGRRIGVAQGDEIHISFMPVQGDIATYLGVSRQNVSTTLAKLRKQNSIVYTRSSFVIRKVEDLI